MSQGCAQEKQKGDSLIHSHGMGTCCHSRSVKEMEGKLQAASSRYNSLNVGNLSS